MTLLLIAAILTAAVAAAVWLIRSDRLQRRRAERVIVNLKSGRAIDGVLVGSGRLLEIADAVVHEPGTQPARADGRVLVHRRDIDFIQVP